MDAWRKCGRFMEHMLLDEYAPPERGNTREAAWMGFQTFWPERLPNWVKAPRETTHRDIVTLRGQLDELDNTVVDDSAAIMERWGAAPYIIAMGPKGKSPHAVAFLVERKHEGIEVHYSNTGLGTVRANKGVAVVIRLNGSMTQLLQTIEFGRRSDFVKGTYEIFAGHVIARYGGQLPEWDGIVHDRHITTAQYATDGGSIVSFPQRGGTCTYASILWLIGPVMLGNRERAREAEFAMKRKGILFLVEEARPEELPDSDAWTCVRVMEATAHAYRSYAPFADIMRRLGVRIRSYFEEAHALMSADTLDVMTMRLWGSAVRDVEFDVTTAPFATVQDAVDWTIRVTTWMPIGTEAHVPLFYLFVEKARDVMNAAIDPDSSAAYIATFLMRFRTQEIDAARGMVMRCVRMVLAECKKTTDARESMYHLRDLRARASLPWVALEYRALCAELRGFDYLLFDTITSEDDTPSTSDDRSIDAYGLEFRSNVQGLTWRMLLAKTRNREQRALNVAMFCLMKWDTRVRCTNGMIALEGTVGVLRCDGIQAFDALSEARTGQFHDDPGMRMYLRLSTEDLVASATRTTGEYSDDDAAMAIALYDGAKLAQSDVEELGRWAGEETKAWEGPNYGVMSDARSLVYCAHKYLEPSAYGRVDIRNFEKILRDKNGGDFADEMRAILENDPQRACERLKNGPPSAAGARTAARHLDRFVMQFATKKGLTRKMLQELCRGADVDGDAVYAHDTLLPVRLSRANGALINEEGLLTLAQPTRGLVFECTSGVRAKVWEALQGANVPNLHWKHTTEDKHTVEACSVVIEFHAGKEPRIGAYTIDDSPSEWSSLWYTTVRAAVIPVRKGGSMSLAVFVCEVVERVDDDLIHFAWDSVKVPVPCDDHLGKFFVVPFDASGVMPKCTAQQAHTLLGAFGVGSVCATRLLPLVIAHEMLGESHASSLCAQYAEAALRARELGRLRESARVELTADVLAWCAREVTMSVGSSAAAPETPMDGVIVSPEEDVYVVKARPKVDVRAYRKRLERMREEGRRKVRYWFGVVSYGAHERATAYLAAAIDAYEILESNTRIGVMMSKACLDAYACTGARVPFEGSSGKFLTKRQGEMIRTMLTTRKTSGFGKVVDAERYAVQVNMGFGKSAVILPLMVLSLIERYKVVIVTQPAHLVASARRIISAAVAARPFVNGRGTLVTSEVRATYKYTRHVVVCSSADLQAAVRDSEEGFNVRFYEGQNDRAHIADEIDEAADPLTCEISLTHGPGRAHYEETDALAFHRVVCEIVLAEETEATVSTETREKGYFARLEGAAARTKRDMKLNINYGLVDRDGIHLALPYKFAKTPAHDARYSDVDASAVLTARAVYNEPHKTSDQALLRALTQIVGSERATEITERASRRQRFMLYAVLVALRQVLHFDSETVVSFVDVLGIARAFIAFSGTMAFELPLPNVRDARATHIPGTGFLHVVPDESGKRLVKRHVTNAVCVPCEGEHDAKRAGRVVEILRRAHETHANRLVVVDASGEFGALRIEDMGFLRSARTFSAAGELRAGDGFVYYEHKHSRGTDAVLDASAVGYVVIDWDRTTLTAASQAMYRLRGIDYGKQTVTFVVCGVDNDTGARDGLYARLVANERARNVRLMPYAQLHRERAESEIDAKESRFEFAREMKDLNVDSTQVQEQEQEQDQDQRQVRHNACVHVRVEKGEHFVLDPLATYERDQYARVSRLHDELREAMMHVSPLLMFHSEGTPTQIEHAFVVMRSGVIVLCALVEVWARKDQDPVRGAISAAYSKEGLRLRGSIASKGDVLFGRYLCGDSLVHDDQVALLEFLTKRRGAEHVHHVVKCLTEAGLIPTHSGVLRALVENAAWWNVTAHDPPKEMVFVNEVMMQGSFGRRFL
jgi:hypothetical protein